MKIYILIPQLNFTHIAYRKAKEKKSPLPLC